MTALQPPLTAAVPGRFGSYPAEDVTWLLTDLSGVALERGTEDREEAIQSGTHYSEMLPVEYQPDDAYLALFTTALEQSAGRLADAVARVGELVWDAAAAAGHRPVLVSLARAGTPIGVLLRRWYRASRGVDVPHYTISIIRGRGIDEVAMAHVLARHPAGALRFVDGWTGKGAIQRQLTEAVAGWVAAHPEDAALDDRLAVLADPGVCTELYGTRDDFLIPSACLNSTVSGLVSRTVLREDLIGPGMFHGAKYYAELAGSDVSELFVDTVAAAFPTRPPADDVPAARRRPTWAGWAAVERIAADHGVADVNLVKPGVGETTRVLLRRVPWQVLVRPDRAADLRHVVALAQARGVPLVEVPGLPYSCVGLIRPVTR
ncbi:PELOTA RNA binding domain-containing protein [Geodermatophilus saharensis]|uniref:PELOTA RNA binding domain-containing protein n=1 Tax=Geodermatophilus saharensis TaxID=1137994 RepID=A0A239HVT1_9ACTN|nr:cysteine protease StiP family protein [Geodermatophilus saharensis]SNS85429.1 PELOTA RNA binding domain-containing protein [Geodermatophilus saharensis]